MHGSEENAGRSHTPFAFVFSKRVSSKTHLGVRELDRACRAPYDARLHDRDICLADICSPRFSFQDEHPRPDRLPVPRNGWMREVHASLTASVGLPTKTPLPVVGRAVEAFSSSPARRDPNL